MDEINGVYQTDTKKKDVGALRPPNDWTRTSNLTRVFVRRTF